MDENNSNNRRDNTTIKAIFSRISNDDELVEEVRNLLADNLQLKSPKNNDGNDGSVGDNNGAEFSIGASSSSSSQSDAIVVRNNEKQILLSKASSRDGNTITSQQQKRRHHHNQKQEEEELAFKIDKNSETYGNILSMAKWYRDSFFISATFANETQELRTRELEEAALRRKEVEEQQKQQLLKHRPIGSTQTLRRYRPQVKSILPSNVNPPMSSPMAMGHPLLLSAGENYIRSTYAVDLLRPYATWAVSRNGPLLHTASQSLAQTIPLGQASCDWAARYNLLWLLQDQEWRDFAKSITTRYINVDDARNGHVGDG